MTVALTKSVDDTRALASDVAQLLQAGDLLLLSGELGAGKTAFVQGLARGLDVVDPVVSPAFVLVRTYPGRLSLTHVDVYRLDHMQELVDLGIAELLDDGGVTAIEWGEVVVPALPSDLLEVRLDPGEADDERWVRFSPVGSSWAARAGTLRRTIGRWTVPE